MSDEDPSVQRAAMAARLRDSREYLGLSQEEVATALKVSRPAVTNIESGVRKVEALELEQLARLYGKSVNYFLSGEQQKIDAKVAFAARALHGLSNKDLDEVARFAEFLRASGGAKGTRSKK